MTVAQYSELFRIECLHEYSGGPCADLTVSPTAGCRMLLDRYRMMFRGAGASAAVYAPARPDGLPGFDENCPFTFALTGSGALDSYTDFSSGGNTSPSENIFYFDNTAEHEAEVLGNPRLLLHGPGSAFAGAGVPVRPRVFQYALPSPGELQVIEPLTKEALWQGASDQRSVLVDLRRLPEGRYQFAVDGKESGQFYLSDRPAARQWGAISIYAGGSRQSQKLPAALRSIGDAGAVTSRTFTLFLNTRKTIWRYYVIDPAGKQDFSAYELTGTYKKPPGATPEINFIRSAETALIDGNKAWVFESQAELPLLQSPSNELSMTLRPSRNGTRGERTIRLPYARPESLALNSGARPGALCSEIFVYV